MDTKAIVKGTLQTLAMTVMGAGITMLMARDLFGLILVSVGVGLIFFKEFFNVKTK